MPILRGTLAATANYSFDPENDFTAGVFNIGSPLDVDGNAKTDADDGLFIARYLLGMRGDLLVAGKTPLPDRVTAETIADKVAEGIGSLDVNNEGGVTAADGILIARYFLGVINGLIAGQSADGSAAAVRERIMKFELTPPPEE